MNTKKFIQRLGSLIKDASGRFQCEYLKRGNAAVHILSKNSEGRIDLFKKDRFSTGSTTQPVSAIDKKYLKKILSFVQKFFVMTRRDVCVCVFMLISTSVYGAFV